VLFELGLKAREKVEGIGRGTGKPGENFVLKEAANLLGRVLQHMVAKGHLTVGGHHHLAVAPHANHGRGANVGTFFHSLPSFRGSHKPGKSAPRRGNRPSCNLEYRSFTRALEGPSRL
jgi:hypothetical protein